MTAKAFNMTSCNEQCLVNVLCDIPASHGTSGKSSTSSSNKQKHIVSIVMITRSQTVARIADCTAKNRIGHVT